MSRFSLVEEPARSAEYMDKTCEKCGSAMAAVSPMKYSPEDPQGARRRKRMDVGSDEWLESLPTTRNEESEEE